MRNPFWRLYVVDRPGITLVHGGRRFAYEVGTVTCIPAWLRFSFHVVPDVGHAWIHFETPTLSSAQVERSCPEPLRLRDAPLHRRLCALGRQLAWTDQHAGLVVEAHALATQAWCTLLGGLRTEAHAVLCGTGSRRLRPVVQYIDQHVNQSLSIADLAAVAGISREGLTRWFQGELGTSPGQYVLERRVSRVADLLLSSDASLDVIAQRCGLGNRRYCSRVFAARMGMPPMRYRAMYRPASSAARS